MPALAQEELSDTVTTRWCEKASDTGETVTACLSRLTLTCQPAGTMSPLALRFCCLENSEHTADAPWMCK